MLARRLLVSGGKIARRRAAWRVGEAIGDSGEAFASLRLKGMEAWTM
jgi:hypothetical protein